MIFNINHKVKVKLNAKGIDYLQSERLPMPEQNAQGWSEWQLWDLMATFGPRIMLGRLPDFETDIEIPENGK